MFSEQLISLATERALGHPTQIQCDLFEELYETYINDSNSSTLREHIVARVAGCNPLAGKLGRDAIHPATNVEKEVKPKNYTGIERLIEYLIRSLLLIPSPPPRPEAPRPL